MLDRSLSPFHSLGLNAYRDFWQDQASSHAILANIQSLQAGDIGDLKQYEHSTSNKSGTGTLHGI